MSYFAVLSKSPTDLEVVRCHINLWVLAGLFGRRIFYFDVGLGLNATPPPESFQLALPVGVNAEDFEDLRQKTETNANLIFGEPALVRDHTLTLGETGTSQTIRLSGLKADKVSESSGRDYSVWKLTPQNWSREGETYVRCRFRVSSFRRNWLAQQSGALVDLRICDVRESARTPNQSGLDDQIVPIGELNLFAILPTSLKCRAASPSPRHVRMLEGEAWSNYLHRSRSSLSARKLTVYYWKSNCETDGSKKIDKRNPFRAFLDLAEERAVLGWKPYLAVILALILIAYAGQLREYALGASRSVVAWAGTLSVGMIWKFGSSLIGWLRKIPAARSLMRKLEEWRYGPS